MSILEHLLLDLIELTREWQHLRQFSELATAKALEDKVEVKKQEILDKVFSGDNLELEYDYNG